MTSRAQGPQFCPAGALPGLPCRVAGLGPRLPRGCPGCPAGALAGLGCRGCPAQGPGVGALALPCPAGLPGPCRGPALPCPALPGCRVAGVGLGLPCRVAGLPGCPGPGGHCGLGHNPARSGPRGCPGVGLPSLGPCPCRVGLPCRGPAGVTGWGRGCPGCPAGVGGWGPGVAGAQGCPTLPRGYPAGALPGCRVGSCPGVTGAPGLPCPGWGPRGYRLGPCPAGALPGLGVAPGWVALDLVNIVA